MKRNIRKAAAFSCVLTMITIFLIPNAAAESKPCYESQVVLENQYDTAVTWNNGAVFIINGSKDSITDQTSMKLVKPDGTVSDFANTQKFDKIYTTYSDPFHSSYRSITDSYYTCDSSYLVVGKDGKKAVLKDDGSFAGNTLYEDILSVTDHFIAVKEDNQYVVRKLDDSTLVAEYPTDTKISLIETDNGLIVWSFGKVIDMFDKNLQKIDLSNYDKVWYSSASLGNNVEIFSQRKTGIMSDTGKVIVPPEFDSVNPFTYNGKTYFNAFNESDNETGTNYLNCTIYKDDGTVFINTTDGGILPYNLDNTGGYFVYTVNNTYGIYDLNSQTVKVDAIYDLILGFDKNCFSYELGGEFGVKTYDNVDIIKPGAIEGNIYSCYIGEGRIVVNVKQGNSTDKVPKCTAYIYAADTGKLITKTDKYNTVGGYINGAAIVSININDNNYANGILDENGNETVSPTYDHLNRIYAGNSNKQSINFPNNTYKVSKDGKVGIIDGKGLPVIDLSYQSLGCFSADNCDSSNTFLFENSRQQVKNLFVCTKQNDKWGLLEITPIVYATGLSLDKTDASLTVGDTVTLKPTISPADATNPKIDWSSSDESVATVKDGVVTALKAGTATITAKTEDGGFTATCTITATEKMTTTATQTTTKESNTTGTNNQSTTNTTTTTAADTKTTATALESPATGELPVAAEALLALTSAFTMAVVIRKRKA